MAKLLPTAFTNLPKRVQANCQLRLLRPRLKVKPTFSLRLGNAHWQPVGLNTLTIIKKQPQKEVAFSVEYLQTVTICWNRHRFIY